MRLLIFGPPGAGKGTQAQFIAQRYGIPHISTGDIFRENIKNNTEMGIEAKRYSDGGELVPDAITNAMVRQRLLEPDSADGFLLDGFPRTPAQADALEEMLPEGTSINAVLNMIVPERELIERLSKRGRLDDAIDTIVKRLRIYHKTTAPIAEYYRAKGILEDIHGVGTIEDVTRQIFTAIDNHR